MSMIPPELDYNLQREFIQKIHDALNTQKEEFVKAHLAKKGHELLANNLKKCRFPDVHIVNHNGWDYVFVNDRSINGKFIVAMSEWKYTPVEIYMHSKIVTRCDAKSSYYFEWQDQDYSPVKINE